MSIYDLYGHKVCFTPVVTATVADNSDETETVLITSGSETEDPIVEGGTDETTATNIMDGNAAENPALISTITGDSEIFDDSGIAKHSFYQGSGPEVPMKTEEKGVDQKTLIIGGIIAAVAVGGIAVAVAMRKK